MKQDLRSYPDNLTDMSSMQIPFSPRGEPSSVAQRWEKWKKAFEYFVIASGITDDGRQRALLLHLIGPDTQEIFETLMDQGNTYDETMQVLDTHFSVQKTYHLKDPNSIKQNKA